MTKDSSSPLAWAVFLGISWTWVIGMFLPALLLRDYGGGAWWLFAVPNVIGAAAMGWVLRTREASTRITTQHATACRAFSVVTIAFHFFFATWFLWPIGPAGFAGLVLCAAAVVTNVIQVGKKPIVAAAIVWGLSLLAFVTLFATGHLYQPMSPPVIDLVDAWPGLSAIMLVGFAASPYFDLTFNHARQGMNTDGAKVAFGVGFGIVFFSMICFTLGYASLVLNPTAGWPRYVVGGHIALQSMITIWLHARELAKRERATDAAVAGEGRSTFARQIRENGSQYVAFALAIAVGIVSLITASRGVRYAGLEPGEIVYRIFLSAYGLFFPAYAWLCLMTGRNDRRAVAVWLVAVLVALPFYWIAFVERQTNWALIGIAIVLAARLFVRKRSRLTSNDARSKPSG